MNLANRMKALIQLACLVGAKLTAILAVKVYFGRDLAGLPGGSIVFFPYRENTLCCGIAAMVSYKQKKPSRVGTAAKRPISAPSTTTISGARPASNLCGRQFRA